MPELLAHNQGDKDVLILDGEQLIGAMQNRMTNRSILLPAGARTKIPVSCMEQGRWRTTTQQMAPSPHHSPSKVRRHARRTEAALATGAAGMAEAREQRPSDVLSTAQSDVWQEIAGYAHSLGAASPTGALDEVYRRREDDLTRWVAAFPREEGQIGILAFVDDRPLAMDLIGGRELYARLHERLLHGYVVDAMAAAAAAGRPEADTKAEEGDVVPPPPVARPSQRRGSGLRAGPPRPDV